MSAWQKPNTLPHPKEAGLFWGAIRVSTLGGPLKWEVHLLCLDDETHDVHVSYDHGWRWADYELWMPCAVPAAPDQPQAREEAQPVAWLRDAHEGDGDECFVPAAKGDPGAFAVFTTPPAPEAEKLRPGKIHTIIMDAVCSDLMRQNPGAFTEEDGNSTIAIPTAGKPFLTIDVSTCAEQALAALQQEGRA